MTSAKVNRVQSIFPLHAFPTVSFNGNHQQVDQLLRGKSSDPCSTTSWFNCDWSSVRGGKLQAGSLLLSNPTCQHQARKTRGAPPQTKKRKLSNHHVRHQRHQHHQQMVLEFDSSPSAPRFLAWGGGGGGRKSGRLPFLAPALGSTATRIVATPLIGESTGME